MSCSDAVRMPVTNRRGTVVAWAVLDRLDAERLCVWRWHLAHGRVYRTGRNANGIYHVALHREVLGIGVGGPHVDHRNRDPLDNRRSNLRTATPLTNNQNQTPLAGRSSRHRGVSYHRATGMWQARVTVEGTSHHLGVFPTEDEAGAAASAFRLRHHDDPTPPPPVDVDSLPVVWTSDGRARRKSHFV